MSKEYFHKAIMCASNSKTCITICHKVFREYSVTCLITKTENEVYWILA